MLKLESHSPLRSFDTILSETLMAEMEIDGPTLHTHSTLEKIGKLDSGLLKLTFTSGKELEVEQVIWSVGRIPSTNGLNLDKAGVELSESGHIKVDEFSNTTAENIYAVDDIIGKVDLTPVAVKEGRLLSERLFNGQTNARRD